jgi:branched-chain amino acid transport system permease protein
MGYFITITILSCINIIAALGLAILTGYTGLFSMGHAGFMAVGGYATAVLYMHLHVPFWLALPLGGIIAGFSSFIIGYPAFRGKLRGDYFAIATLGFAEAVRLLFNTNYKWLGGAYGFTGIPQLTSLPLAVGLAGVALIGAHYFVTSQYGKNCIAVGQDETAAQMMGVNLLRTKLTALFVSAFYAGIAGGLFGFYIAYLSPSYFNLTRSSDLLAAVVFGGMQSLIGPAIATFLIVAVPELLRFLLNWRLVIYGLLFVVIMVFRPQGLLGYREMNLKWLRKLLARAARKPGAGTDGGAA